MDIAEVRALLTPAANDVGRLRALTDLCRAYAPALEPKAPGHLAACHYALCYRREGASRVVI